jgi:phosphotransferase system  glucose/maltose/N-acetylglucosamine-specific IIC component
MTSVSFLASAVLLTLGAYFAKRVSIAVMAAFAWLLLGLWAYSNYTTMWDNYYMLFWFSIGCFLAVLVDSVYILIQEQARQNREERGWERDEKIDEANEKKKDLAESGLHPMDKLRQEQGLPPSEARKRNQEKQELKRWRM